MALGVPAYRVAIHASVSTSRHPPTLPRESHFWWTTIALPQLYRGGVTRARQLLFRYGLDLLICLAALEAAIATALKESLDHPSGPVHWFEVVAVAAVVLTLLGRRRFPFAAPAATWLASAVLSFVDGELIVNQSGLFLAGMGAAVLLGNQRSPRQAYAGLAIVVASAAVVVSRSADARAEDVLSIPVLFGIGWLIGFALRERTQRTEAAEERAARAEREREAAARVAVAEERGRIARELHDVVAHAVSMMLLQVGAVRHRMPESAQADREALRNVEEAGRTALTEMRRLLNAMRQDEDAADLAPHPGLDDLERLVRDVGAAGLDVDLQFRGDAAPLPPGLDLSAYRIVQEALTNSLRHSGPGQVEVTVTYEPGALRLEVRDHGPGIASGASDGHGHGLVGVRERVKLFGGEMSAHPAPGGGFLVKARLPLGGDDS
ncbi:sensor histidine kinase [Nocardioides sp.]|uniref:sensor histidine kinase n=1 Tax=Nocardioides sp. TaxID=35761 RepID=UPI002ED4BBF7